MCVCVCVRQVGTGPDYRDRADPRGAQTAAIGTPAPQLLCLYCTGWVCTNPGPYSLGVPAPTYATLLVG